MDGPLTRKGGLAIVAGDERTVVLDLDRLGDPPLVLDGSAEAVWDALAEPRTSNEVIGEVAERYGESPETVGPSVRAFLSDLIDRGLLVEPAL